ncbi:MAG TPA: twin-arginine translocation signal domain-containing protein [Pyrinomonadaceae bacterium]|nr:twin-arginine translocation signal domain-containing protein [Pyrinomonadaceae bacterium]
MGTSRRDFIKKGSLVALVAGVPVSLAERTAAGETAVPSSALGLSKAAFLAQLNSTFLINEGGSKVAVRLVDVADLPRRGASARKEAFSLLFRGDKATALKQSTYLIEHEKLGLFSFLMVPIMSKDKRALHYEAIINRLHP